MLRAAAAGGKFIILCSAATVVILAWMYLFHLRREMASSMADASAMAAMGMRTSWTAGDVALTFAMWTVMMIGMMTPSVAPVLLIVARSSAARGARNIPAVALVFGAGYLTAWTFFSALAALAQWALHAAAMLSTIMTTTSAPIGGAVLIAAGLYQLTPLKRACLVQCRSPLDFLMTRFRSGLSGAFRMGLHHGAYCLGCCWALMAVLFVVGVMNLSWVAAIAVFVLIEKIAPAGAAVGRVAGVGLIAGGVIEAVYG